MSTSSIPFVTSVYEQETTGSIITNNLYPRERIIAVIAHLADLQKEFRYSDMIRVCYQVLQDSSLTSLERGKLLVEYANALIKNGWKGLAKQAIDEVENLELSLFKMEIIRLRRDCDRITGREVIEYPSELPEDPKMRISIFLFLEHVDRTYMFPHIEFEQTMISALSDQSLTAYEKTKLLLVYIAGIMVTEKYDAALKKIAEARGLGVDEFSPKLDFLEKKSREALGQRPAKRVKSEIKV